MALLTSLLLAFVLLFNLGCVADDDYEKFTDLPYCAVSWPWRVPRLDA